MLERFNHYVSIGTCTRHVAENLPDMRTLPLLLIIPTRDLRSFRILQPDT